MAKTYQLSKAYKYGTMMKIVPVTTEKEMNEVSCLQVNGTSNFSVEPQSILPDLTGFKVSTNSSVQVNGTSNFSVQPQSILPDLTGFKMSTNSSL